MSGEDETLAYLLDLDGEEIIYDGGYVARFTVKRIAATQEASRCFVFADLPCRGWVAADGVTTMPTGFLTVAAGLSVGRRRSIIGTVTKPTKGSPTGS